MNPFSSTFIPENLQSLNSKIPDEIVFGPFEPLCTFEWRAKNFGLGGLGTTQQPEIPSQSMLPPEEEFYHRMPETPNGGTILEFERRAKNQILKNFTLYDVSVRVKKSPLVDLIEIDVPGISDSNPVLIPGDFVVIRCIHAPVDVQLRLRLASVDRNRSRITAFCPPFFLHSSSENRYNISFVQSYCFYARMTRAVEFLKKSKKAQDLLQGKGGPLPRNGPLEERSIMDAEWNLPQEKFIKNVVLNPDSRIRICFGPPGSLMHSFSFSLGTGKTKVAVELIRQLFLQNDKHRILVCAPSISAADTICTRLAAFFKPKVLFRLNDSKKVLVKSSLFPPNYYPTSR